MLPATPVVCRSCRLPKRETEQHLHHHAELHGGIGATPLQGIALEHPVFRAVADWCGLRHAATINVQDPLGESLQIGPFCNNAEPDAALPLLSP